jgi:hypothetical protein
MIKKIGCLPVILIALILVVVVNILELRVFGIFFIVSMVSFMLPEMENSLDRVYLGREVTKDSTFKYDFIGVLCLVLEIVFDIVINS